MWNWIKDELWRSTMSRGPGKPGKAQLTAAGLRLQHKEDDSGGGRRRLTLLTSCVLLVLPDHVTTPVLVLSSRFHSSASFTKMILKHLRPWNQMNEAPCRTNPSPPSEAQERQDSDHRGQAVVLSGPLHAAVNQSNNLRCVCLQSHTLIVQWCKDWGKNKGALF